MYARYIPYITLSIRMLYVATICVAVRKYEVVSAVELLVVRLLFHKEQSVVGKTNKHVLHAHMSKHTYRAHHYWITK